MNNLINRENLIIEKEDIIDSSELYDYLLCPICKELVRDAITCSKCNDNFCKRCINTWQSTGHKDCPCCQQTWTHRNLDKALQKILDSYLIMCKYPECSEIVKCRDLNGHMEECKYKKISCIYCNYTSTITDMGNHLITCPLVRKSCPYSDNGCPFTDTKVALIGHILNKCGYMQIQCTGCKSLIDYKEYFAHMEQCLSMIMKCEYCGFIGPRGEFNPHQCANEIFKLLNSNKEIFWDNRDHNQLLYILYIYRILHPHGSEDMKFSTERNVANMENSLPYEEIAFGGLYVRCSHCRQIGHDHLSCTKLKYRIGKK